MNRVLLILAMLVMVVLFAAACAAATPFPVAPTPLPVASATLAVPVARQPGIAPSAAVLGTRPPLAPATPAAPAVPGLALVTPPVLVTVRPVPTSILPILNPQRLSEPTVTAGGCQPLVGRDRLFTDPAAAAVERYLGPGGVEMERGGKGAVPVFFIDGQLLVSGRPDVISKVIDLVNTRLRGQIGDGLIYDAKGGEIGRIDRAGFETRLYRFAAGKMSSAEAMRAVRQASAELGLLVLADLNLLGAPTLPKGCDVAGAPGLTEDSPLCGEDSSLWGPSGYLHLPNTVAPDKLFWDQWALSDTKPGGIHVSEAGGPRKGIPTGSDTQIVILDTSPFAKEGLATFSGPGWMTPNLQVCVEHPVDVSPGLGEPCGQAQDGADHGIFVAGLAHAAATKSALYLERVLNEHGRGELRSTLYVLANLDRSRLKNTKTVINMSLGFTPEPGATPLNWQDQCRHLGVRYCNDILDLLANAPSLTKEQVKAMQDALEGAVLEAHIADLVDQGVVVVAAAGNHGDAGSAPEPEMPARFAAIYPSGVMAVAATTAERVRAFYSHQGTIAAPGGGDNRPGCAKKPGVSLPGLRPACWSQLDDWVISVATHRTATGVDWGYGAWAGTSFATPLVSGMVAGAFSGGSTQPADKVNHEVCAPPNPAPGNLGHGIAGYCP